MSRITAADRLKRVLAVVPYIVANPGERVADVADRFGLTEKALLEDLSVVFMVGLPPYSPDSLIDVDIDSDGRVTIGLADYFSRPLKLTPAQGLGLVAASDALLSVPGTDTDGSLSKALAKLAAVMGVEGKDPVDVHLGPAEHEILTQLRKSAAAGTEVELRYFSYGRDEVTERRVAPWRVFADGGSWYMSGWCHRAGAERLFRIDRIDRLVDTGEPSTVTPPEAADEARGVSGGLFSASENDPRVTLRIDSSASWVAEAYPHDEVVENGDGTIDITLAITKQPWLERLLVRLGPSAEIVDNQGLPDAEKLGTRVASRILRRYR